MRFYSHFCDSFFEMDFCIVLSVNGAEHMVLVQIIMLRVKVFDFFHIVTQELRVRSMILKLQLNGFLRLSMTMDVLMKQKYELLPEWIFQSHHFKQHMLMDVLIWHDTIKMMKMPNASDF